jgi:uncharacterized membrane protein YheB (UPF0754 family)
MNPWLIMIPIAGAFLGWILTASLIKMLFHPRWPKRFLGLGLQGYIPKNRAILTDKIAAGISKGDFFSIDEIAAKVSNPENFQQIMPMAAQHIDEFLRLKLPKAMPMISMFIGDRTINQLKTVFMDELEQLFPQIMQSYIGNLKSEINIEQLIRNKINQIPTEKMEQWLMIVMKKQVRLICLLGAGIGLVTGIFQILLMFLLPST